MSGTVEIGGFAPSLISVTKVSTLVLVAVSALATDSVDGQRARPSGVMRFDLLKVVGSRPAFLASADAVMLLRAARRSSAFQIWACVSIVRSPGAAAGSLAIRIFQVGIIPLKLRVRASLLWRKP